MTSAAPSHTFYSSSDHQSYTFGNSAHRALFLHGFMGTPRDLRGLGQALAQQGWQTHCDTLPGFGRNIANLANTQHGDWLNAVHKSWTTHIEDAQTRVLIGYSLGGALATALAHQLKPDYLILLAPFTRIAFPFAGLLPLVPYVIKELRPFEKADFSQPHVRKQFQDIDPTIDIDNPAVQARLRKEITLPTAVLNEIRLVGKRATQTAASLNVPTLIMQGREDVTVRPKFTQRLAKKLGPQTTYIELPGDHELPKQPAARTTLLAHITPFLPTLSQPATIL